MNEAPGSPASLMPEVQIRLIKLPGDEGYSDILSQETDGPPQVYKGPSLLTIKQRSKSRRVWVRLGMCKARSGGMAPFKLKQIETEQL